MIPPDDSLEDQETTGAIDFSYFELGGDWKDLQVDLASTEDQSPLARVICESAAGACSKARSPSSALFHPFFWGRGALLK